MITEQDLQEAIAACEGERHPNANTCIKLAAFYTIKANLFPDTTKMKTIKTESDPNVQGYSFALPAVSQGDGDKYISLVGNYGNSDFLQLVSGMPETAVWKIIDELMETLAVINPRLYDGVVRKLKQM